MMEFDNAMRRHVYSLPALLREQLPKSKAAASVFGKEEALGFSKVILTGCGDSLAAALSVRDAFIQWMGLDTQALPAIEVSRGLPRSLLEKEGKGLLVVVISTSGAVARSAEAAKRAVDCDAFVLALTGNPESRLAKWSTRCCRMELPPFEPAPGIRNYMLSVMTLLELAMELGVLRGTLSREDADRIYAGMLAQAEELEKMLPRMDRQLLETARQWRDLEAFDFIASGADYGTAFFGQAKVFEAVGRYAMVSDTEDWMHMNCFLRRTERIGTVVVCGSRNPALGRVDELLAHADRDLKRPLLLITDDPEAFTWRDPRRTVVLPKAEDPFSGILNQLAPISLIFGYIGEMIGEVDGRGCADNWSFCRDGDAVINSGIYYE